MFMNKYHCVTPDPETGYENDFCGERFGACNLSRKRKNRGREEKEDFRPILATKLHEPAVSKGFL